MVTRLALVDDDQNILTSVALMLEAEGYEVDTYFDSEQALSGLLRRLRWRFWISKCRVWMAQNCWANCASVHPYR